jgi:hypothetical protein
MPLTRSTVKLGRVQNQSGQIIRDNYVCRVAAVPKYSIPPNLFTHVSGVRPRCRTWTIMNRISSANSPGLLFEDNLTTTASNEETI